MRKSPKLFSKRWNRNKDYLRVAIGRGRLHAKKVGRDWLVQEAEMARVFGPEDASSRE